MTDLSCPLWVEPLEAERGGLGLFVLLRDFVAITEAAGLVRVDRGYTTDFASIPRIARWILPQCGRSAKAALLHDWLLHQNDERAAAVFNECLKATGSGLFRRWLMVAVVKAYAMGRAALT